MIIRHNYTENTQLPLAAEKVNRIIHFYPKNSDIYATLIAWLRYAKDHGSAPNAKELSSTTGFAKQTIVDNMNQVNHDLIRIGMKPMRIRF